MPLPARLRKLVPDRVRRNARLRAAAVGRGLIPPMTMHTEAEAALLAKSAAGRSRAVEIGVFEGSSAKVLAEALPTDASLHLIDPYQPSDQTIADAPRRLPRAEDWRGTQQAAARVVERITAKRGGPHVEWHLLFSDAAVGSWGEPVDLVFIDGDHRELACRLDWELWSPFVVEGGVVLFHDARRDKPGGWGDPGPTIVCDQLFRGPDAISGWRIAGEVDTVVAVERTA